MASSRKIVTLGDLGLIVTGKTPSTKVPDHFGGGIPFVTPRDMDGRKRIFETERHLTENGVKAVGSAVIPAGSIMVSCIGSDMGKVAIAGRECVTNQQINSIVVSEEYASEYVYYNLSQRKIELRSMASGSAQPILNKGHFSQVGIELPKIPEQRAIAHILGSLDDKIELNRRMNQTLEAMARAIFKSWFVDFDPVRAKAEGRPTGLPDDIDALFPDSFEDSELGEIPKGWEVSTIGENAEKLSKGTTPRKNDVLNAQDAPSIPFLKVRNISEEGEIDLSNLDRIPRSIHEGFLKRSILKTNDVLFSIAGTIGRVSILPEELNDSNVNQAIAFVRPKKNELPSTFLRLILISDRIQDEASSRVVQGVQANVSLTVLSDLRFANPPQSIVDIWLRYFGGSFSRQELLLRESRSLSSLRDTLLPKLISGELRVPDAEKLIAEAGV